MAVSYIGPSNITSLTFNPQGASAPGGSPTSGNNGLDLTNAYTSNSFPGMIFSVASKAFTVGSGSVGLTQADVSAVPSNPPPPPGSASTGRTLTLNFGTSNFTGGKVLRFTVGRGVEHPSAVNPPVTASTLNYSADLFGGGVLIPEGTVLSGGMPFSGTLADGSTFSGTMANRIGAGYSVLDGFGFINLQAAVAAPLP